MINWRSTDMQGKKVFVLFLLEVLALTAFLENRVLSLQPGQGSSGFILVFAFLLGPALILGVVLFQGIKLYAAWLARLLVEDSARIAADVVFTLCPLFLLPLVLLRYLLFLNDIGPAILPVSLAAVIWLHATLLARLRKDHPGTILRFRDMSDKQISAITFFVPLIVYSFLASGLVFPQHPLTGDEPHYLIITKSILSDGDINVFNNYQNRDYLKFYPGPLDSHARPGKRGPQFHYSRHMPALSLLLVPFYFLGEKTGLGSNTFIFIVRFPIILLTALLGWLLFKWVSQLSRSLGIALVAWLAFSFTAPQVFFSSLIYPEIPAALTILLVLWDVFYWKGRSSVRLLFAGLGVALLPWLGIKYSPLAVLLSGLIILLKLKAEKQGWKRWLIFVGPLVGSAGLLLYYYWTLYGSLSPGASYAGTFGNRNFSLAGYFHFRVFEFMRLALIHLFDQRIGLLPYSPVYLFSVAGFLLLWKKRKKEAVVLSLVFAFYWGFCSLGYYTGGYCPPGRTLLPVSWILALFMAEAFAWSRGRLPNYARRGLILISFVIVALSLPNPRVLYHDNLSFSLVGGEINSQLLASVSNSFLDFRKLVPILSGYDHINWIALVLWLMAIAGITILSLKRNPGQYPSLRPRTHLALVLLFCLGLLGYRFFNAQLEKGIPVKGTQCEVFPQDQNNYGEELGGFWTKGRSQTVLFLYSPAPLAEITLHISSPVEGKTTVQAGGLERIVERGKSAGLNQAVTFASPRGFPWKRGSLYYLRLRENEAFSPSKLDKNSHDGRSLGVFVTIDTKTRAAGLQ